MGEKSWRNGVDLTVSVGQRLAWGSIWPLEQGTEVEVVVDFHGPGAGKTLTGTACTREMVLEPLGGRDFHVSPGGSDDAAGTREHPFRTLARASSAARPGDIVHVLEGTYHEGNLFAALQGTPDKPIVIAAGEGQKPVMDGSVEIAKGEGGWKKVAEGVYAIELTTPTGYAGYAAQDGLRMFWSKTLQNLMQGCLERKERDGIRKLPIERSWFFDKENSLLYVRPGDGLHPAEHGYKVAVYEYAALLSGSRNVVLRGFEIRFYGESAVHLEEGAQGCVIYGNLIHHAQRGVTFEDSLTADNAVWHNEIFEKGLLDYTWTTIKASEYGRQALDGAAGRGNSFCYNEIHGYFDAVAPAFWGNWGRFHFNRDMDIMYNRMYNIGDDAIEVEGGGLNVRVHGNTMRNVFSAISLAPIENGPIYVTRNDASYLMLMFKLNVGNCTSLGWTYCYHNSGYCLTRGDQYGGTAVSFPSAGSIPISHKVFKNNAFICDGMGLRLANQRYDIDYNCYGSVPGQGPVVFRWEAETGGKWKSSDYTLIDEFSAATGRETHGLAADPGFAATDGLGAEARIFYADAAFNHYTQLKDINSGSLQLSAESPCVDKGAVIRGINEDFQGKAPDIGAFEFGSQ
ncbi:MAG: right-handed parallel beta-helix repeat-containing protein [Candidatus Glassbacteria bacterium]|nr:right-handed parallel beta-helix repeat-containing protein [Candidatus Glassbacteria bacterium]